VFEKQSYGIVLKENSPYRQPINLALLRLKETGAYGQLYEKWFGSNQ
jgi:polar amino acid transport system substrate-binding protein